jgi:hypothetical protein
MVTNNKIERLNMDNWKLDSSFFSLVSTKDVSNPISYEPEDEACCDDCRCKN